MTTDDLERRLAEDVQRLGDRLADNRFCTELYRALTDRALRNGAADRHVTVSWCRAAEIVDSARAAAG